MRSLHTKPYQAFIAVMVLARQEGDMSQHELARRIGKPQSFVSKYERRERRLDVAEFIKVARALGLDPAKLIRRIDKALSYAQSRAVHDAGFVEAVTATARALEPLFARVRGEPAVPASMARRRRVA